MFNTDRLWPAKIHALLAGLFCIAFAAMLFLQATKPIYDPDFWWHLKTGETMVEQGGLLQSDPFSFHDNSEYETREKIILKGYWLWQVTAYGLYNLFGLNGILLLNLLTLSAMAIPLAFQFVRLRISPGLAAPLLVAGFCLTRYFPLERPQAFSFVFAILLVGLLVAVRRGGQLGLSLPIVMCLWANVHGGFVLGDLILLCFAVGVIVEYRHDRSRMKHLLAWTCAGLVASLVNPNGGAAFIEVFSFHGSNMMSLVPEYQGTWISFAKGRQVYALLWLLVALYFGTTLLLRRVFWPEFLIAAFLAYVSVRYTRNAPFFSLAMLPAIGWSLRELFQRWRSFRFQVAGIMATSVALIATLWLVQTYWKSWQPHEKMRMFYPVEAADFLDKSALQGRMISNYEFGGYLLWRLSPDFSFFIDGRAINPDVFTDYRRIFSASADAFGGQNDYLRLLNAYKIDYIVQSIYDAYSGNIQPLMAGLLGRPEWVPIYLDEKVYVLARVSQVNKNNIEPFRIDKNEFKHDLLHICNELLRKNPQQVRFRVARAGLLIYMGYYEDAKNEVDMIATVAPKDNSLPSLRQGLQILAWRRARSLD